MRAVVFSDLHCHPWPAFSRLDESGTNTRLRDTLRVLELVAKAAIDRKADCIIFAGDFFHTQRIEAEVLHLAAETLSNFPINIPILAIEGNHDQATKIMNLTSVSGLRVPRQWNWLRNLDLRVSGIHVWGVPYGSEAFPKPVPDIAVLHRGVHGAQVSDYFLSGFEHDLKLEDAHLYAKKLVICGHYHKPQFFENDVKVLIPGSPLQHTWGDVGQDRGIWIIDVTDKVSCEFLPLDLPKFIRITEENIDDLAKAEGNFVSVEFAITAAAEMLDGLVKDLSKTTRGFSVMAGAPEIVRPVGDRMKISSDLEGAIKEYAKRFGGEKAKALEDIGLDLLKRARD